MNSTPPLRIDGNSIRQDKTTNYLNIVDLATAAGRDSLDIANWLRTRSTVDFIGEWELKHNPDFNYVEFDIVKRDAGSNTFRLSVKTLEEIGCTSIFARSGRYGGTYAAVQLAFHFAHWLSSKFYLNTLDSYLEQQKRLFGETAARKRFARELAAEDYDLVRKASKKALPRKSDKLVARRAIAAEMDVINIAVFQLTAKQWREKVRPSNPRDNMRNYASPEENLIIAKLEHLNSVYIENSGDIKTRLELLCQDALKLLNHHYKTKEAKLEYRRFRAERGW